MSEIIELNQTDEEMLSYEVSDEALEAAGTVGKENAYTLGACSGLSVCPGYITAERISVGRGAKHHVRLISNSCAPAFHLRVGRFLLP